MGIISTVCILSVVSFIVGYFGLFIASLRSRKAGAGASKRIGMLFEVTIIVSAVITFISVLSLVLMRS